MRGGLPVAEPEPPVEPIEITSIAAADTPKRLLYALDTSVLSGVFLLDLETGEERRLFHSNELRVRSLAREPAGTRIACSLFRPNGSKSLALIEADGGGLAELTEGDSIDAAPSWCGGGRIVYQSCGLARLAGGVVESGPIGVHSLDLERGTVETLLEDPQHDYLVPRMAQGALLHPKAL